MNKQKYILASLFFIFLGILGLLIFSGYKKYRNIYNSNRNIETTAEKNTAEISTTTQTINQNFLRNLPGSNDGTQYKNENLEKTAVLVEDAMQKISNTDKLGFYSKKALLEQTKVSLLLSSSSKDNSNQDFISILNELNKTLNEIDNLKNTEHLKMDLNLLRSRYLYIINLIFENSEKNTLSSSDFSKTKEYQHLLSLYPKNTNLVELLYLQELYEISYIENDNFTISAQMSNISKILHTYEKDIPLVLKNNLILKFKQLKDKYLNSKQTSLFTSPYSKEMVPAVHYAQSLTVLSNYDTSISKNTVLLSFKTALDLIKQKSLNKIDKSHLLETWIYLSYANYLFELNNGKIDSEIIQNLKKAEENIDITFKDQSEIQNLFEKFVQRLKSPTTLKQINLLKIAEENSGFKTFLQVHGLEK